MVKVELVSAEGSQVLVGDFYSDELEINVGVINEKTMDPLNLIAVFEGGSSGNYEEGPLEVRVKAEGSRFAYSGISYSTDDGQSWQSFPTFSYEDFNSGNDYIVVLENVEQIKFRIKRWYSLECEQLGFNILNETQEYKYSDNYVLHGPITLYADQ